MLERLNEMTHTKLYAVVGNPIAHSRSPQMQNAGLEELGEAGLVEAKTFNKRLLEFWDELRQRVSPNGVIDYWSFVRTSQFSETVARAQFVSFLVTYGYATMQRDGDNIILRPNEKPFLPTTGSPLSFPISIPREGS